MSGREPELSLCRIPVWGYGALGNHRETILSRLFQKVAKEVYSNKKVHFEIKLYAHDENIIRFFSLLITVWNSM